MSKKKPVRDAGQRARHECYDVVRKVCDDDCRGHGLREQEKSVWSGWGAAGMPKILASP